jgi:hypothetical protein
LSHSRARSDGTYLPPTARSPISFSSKPPPAPARFTGERPGPSDTGPSLRIRLLQAQASRTLGSGLWAGCQGSAHEPPSPLLITLSRRPDLRRRPRFGPGQAPAPTDANAARATRRLPRQRELVAVAVSGPPARGGPPPARAPSITAPPQRRRCCCCCCRRRRRRGGAARRPGPAPAPSCRAAGSSTQTPPARRRRRRRRQRPGCGGRGRRGAGRGGSAAPRRAAGTTGRRGRRGPAPARAAAAAASGGERGPGGWGERERRGRGGRGPRAGVGRARGREGLLTRSADGDRNLELSNANRTKISDFSILGGLLFARRMCRRKRCARR